MVPMVRTREGGSRLVGEVAGWERHDRGGGVVGDVEHEGERRGAGFVVVGGEELCGAQDEQRCGAVPEFERGDAGEHSSEWWCEDSSDA